MNFSTVLYSDLAPTAAAEALRQSMNEERRTLFSFSGYKGDLPILGTVSGNTFRLQKRRFWRNDFAPNFYGVINAEPNGGTAIEGRFDLSPSVKIFMRIWIVLAALIGVPILVGSAFDLMRGTDCNCGEPWVGIVVPPAMLLWGFILPKLGMAFAQNDQQIILDHLQKVLVARLERPGVGH